MMISNFFILLMEVAGVGKSILIKAVYQSILRLYNSLPRSNPETIRVTICAPTGKAAAILIGGMTLHSFLSLPVNQCKYKLVKLDSDVSNRTGVKIERLAITNNRRNINGWFYNVSTDRCSLAANNEDKRTIR